MFFDNFVRLCNKVGKSPSAVAIELGFQKSAVTNWKKRKTNPTSANLAKIADYFNVSEDYLTGDEAKEKPTVKNDDRHNALLAQLAKDSEGQELLEKFGQLSSDNRSKFLELIDLYLEAQGRNKKSS